VGCRKTDGWNIHGTSGKGSTFTQNLSSRLKREGRGSLDV